MDRKFIIKLALDLLRRRNGDIHPSDLVHLLTFYNNWLTDKIKDKMFNHARDTVSFKVNEQEFGLSDFLDSFKVGDPL